MLKLKHLLHPRRTASRARAVAKVHWTVRRLASRGERRFRGDSRYDLENVTAGFASRRDERSDDTVLLERICTAYARAMELQSSANHAYQPTSWWQTARGGSTPMQEVLAAGDTDALRTMFQNFFRDPCSAGLIGVPPLNTAKLVYSGGALSDLHRRFLMSDALHRIEYWKAETEGRFPLRALEAPDVGNPYGVVIEGRFVAKAAEYQHYCAHRICELLPSGRATVMELGGGFGQMAYYLLRDRPGSVYVGLDVPECLALSAYYLQRALPELTFLLYGEDELTGAWPSDHDVLLMPLFELASIPTAAIDVAFSSHAMSSLSPDALLEYTREIARCTRGHFLYVGDLAAGVALRELIGEAHTSYTLVEERLIEWHMQQALEGDETECLYQVGAPRAGRPAGT